MNKNKKDDKNIKQENRDSDEDEDDSGAEEEEEEEEMKVEQNQVNNLREHLYEPLEIELIGGRERTE